MDTFPIKLTKRQLMSFETGIVIASNITPSPGESIYVEKVAPPEKREEQWREICQAEANGRTVQRFRNRAEYVKHLGALARMTQESKEDRPRKPLTPTPVTAADEAQKSTNDKKPISEDLHDVRMTRKALMALKTGLIIVTTQCNCDNHTTCHVAEVAAIEDRPAQWEDIRNRGLHGKLFRVFSQREAYQSYLLRLREAGAEMG